MFTRDQLIDRIQKNAHVLGRLAEYAEGWYRSETAERNAYRYWQIHREQTRLCEALRCQKQLT